LSPGRKSNEWERKSNGKGGELRGMKGPRLEKKKTRKLIEEKERKECSSEHSLTR